MESNISRDQVQLEVLCALIKSHTVKHQTIWNKIGASLGLCKPQVWVTEPLDLLGKATAITSMVMELRQLLGNNCGIGDVAKRLKEKIEQLNENATKE